MTWHIAAVLVVFFPAPVARGHGLGAALDESRNLSVAVALCGENEKLLVGRHSFLDHGQAFPPRA